MARGGKPVTRRRVLGQSVALSTLSLAGALGACETTAPVAPRNQSRMFTLGVASGDPAPDSVVIWTRLAPDPLNGGGMPPTPVKVRWEVASDDRMQKIVKQGTATARPEFAHALHVEVKGLLPHRWYWYRFNVAGEESPIGRTRTAAAAGQKLDAFRFAFASCQKYEQGYYTAYQHMVEEELDLVIHLGDYIYESGPQEGLVRLHNSEEVKTLEAYRNRYALYKLDPNLQAAHAAFPWAAVPDDHEVHNDYANDKEVRLRVSPEAFLKRRAAAYQAYYEHLPFRRFSKPRGPNMQLYRRLDFGDLASVQLLDTRQYRSDQPCGKGWVERCREALDPRATMLGQAQELWLNDQFSRHTSRWTVLAQQVPVMQRKRIKGGEIVYNVDKWDGYVAARQRLFDAVQRYKPSGLIVLSGDIHANVAATLKADFQSPVSATLGAEFVCTSISSYGNGWDRKKKYDRIVAGNPHIAFYNGRRGYVRCVVDRARWQTDFRVLPYVTRPGAPIETRASFTVEQKAPGLAQV